MYDRSAPVGTTLAEALAADEAAVIHLRSPRFAIPRHLRTWGADLFDLTLRRYTFRDGAAYSAARDGASSLWWPSV